MNRRRKTAASGLGKRVWRKGAPLEILACLAGAGVLTTAIPLPLAAAKLVDLDASGLPSGQLSSWSSTGKSRETFESAKLGGATVATVDGRKAVSFDGTKDFLKSTFPAPVSITAGNAWTIAVRVFNPQINDGEEPLVYWAHRGVANRGAHLNYGSAKNTGAVVHWSADMGYGGGSPEAGKWHLVVLTYAGGKDGLESLYVDGKLSGSAKRTLDLFTDDPIFIGVTDLARYFSGSISEICILDKAASAEELASAGMTGAGEMKPEKPLVWLKAEGLSEGRIEKWPNRGTLDGSFAGMTSAPEVGETAGRKAVLFNGRSWLDACIESSLLSGAFTVEYWVFRKDMPPDACPVLSVGDLGNQESGRFSFGRNSMDGAWMVGGARAGFDYPAPAGGAWHHVAYVRSADGELKLYVDGELSKTNPCPKVEARGLTFRIGAACLPGKGTAAAATGLSIAKMCIYDEALPQAAIRKNNGQFNAFAPVPANKSEAAGFDITLKWSEACDKAQGADVYFGTDKKEAEGADRRSKTFRADVPSGKGCFGPVKVELGQMYYWRVDQTGEGRAVLYKGELWSFASETGRAATPAPQTHVSAVPADTRTLRWTPGRYAVSQTVLFSEDEAAVQSGAAVITRVLEGHVSQCDLPKALECGKKYFWRVDSKNGAHPATTGEVWRFRTADRQVTHDITFFAVSDLHYTVLPPTLASNQGTIDFMNELPGTACLKEAGGAVGTPRGVVITGDLTNDGMAEQWALFVKDYGVKGEGRICYPVYEGWGNHDGGLVEGAAPARGIKERNKVRPGLTNISSNGLHYAWDWGQVHFVQQNFYPGDARVRKGAMDGLGHEPQFSLAFLKEDLAKCVGRSGRPVIIMTHLGFDEGFSMAWGWWSAEERDAFYEVIKDYNVIGVLYGHTHAAANFKWRGIDIYNCASGNREPEPGECLVFHITPEEMTVMHRFKGRWAEVWKKAITGFPKAE
ncbi:MAG: LamG-like jellyroll fold domain-containing protein [bacterium]